MIDINKLELLYFSNDEPCPYNLKCGFTLNISPIKVKNWINFENSIEILLLKKNEINDIKIVQMSYLEFLEKVVFVGDEISKKMLANIFYYSLGEENVFIVDGKIVLTDDEKKVKGVITNKEFEEISKIILYQNLIDYDDRYINPDVQREKEEYIKIKYKNSIQPTLERKKIYVMSKSGFRLKEICNMSYRIFSQLFSEFLDYDSYIIENLYKTSEKYEIKEDIKHPLFAKKKDIFDELFISKESLEEKMG